MEIAEETDNITKNIVHEIMRECATKKIKVNINFCTFYVKLLTLDPVWNISPEKKIDRIYIQKLVQYVIEKLRLSNSPSITTIKMQQHFLAYNIGFSNLIMQNENNLLKNLEPLLDNIINFVLDESTKAKLYKRIVLYITLKSGLGDPRNNLVIKESQSALKSIFTDSDLNQFCELTSTEKEEQLEFMNKIVMGIRLFNHNRGFSSVEINDLPKYLAQSLASLETSLQKELLNVMEKVNMTTSAIDNVFTSTVNQNDKNLGELTRQRLILIPPEGVTHEDVAYSIDILTLLRQYEVSIRKLISDVEQINIATKVLTNSLHKLMKRLQRTVQYKLVISANIVYPIFTRLSDLWLAIQDQAVILSIFLHMYEYLRSLISNVNMQKDILLKMIGTNEILTDGERLRKMKGVLIKIAPDSPCKLLEVQDDITNIPLQLLGFCIWTFLETHGALIPGNPNLGILEWRKQYYVFASPEAAMEFSKNPNWIIMKALMIVKKKPELINLLQLQTQIHKLRTLVLVDETRKVETFTVNRELQTETHPIPRYKDPDYVWNVWDYYRKAQKLATIINRKTHATQTIKSHHRQSVAVQKNNVKDTAVQTKKDNYTNVPTPSVYLYGLRGNTKAFQITDLTLPIKSPCFVQSELPRTNNYPKNPRSMKLTLKDITSSESTLDHLTAEESLKKSLTSCICISSCSCD